MALKNFSAPTRTRFVNEETHKWAQRGNWRPDYFRYIDVAHTQYLVVSDLAICQFNGKPLEMERTYDEDSRRINVKDMENLGEPGTYWLARKGCHEI
jgi:hypothetical protein